MKDRPILFSAPMVRAILDGRKTQTRRVVTHPLGERADAWAANDDGWWECGTYGDGGSVARAGAIRCPYGASGDRLWVRETFQPLWATDKVPPHGMAKPDGWALGYVATDGVQEWHDPDDGLVARCKPAIHMPRWASRIALEVTGVRVERLQGISEDDAEAEGVDPRFEMSLADFLTKRPVASTYRIGFKHLWDAINGKRAPWDLNPWVWVVEFRRVDAAATEAA